MTSLYSHDIILVLFQWIIKQNYKEEIVTGDWSQSMDRYTSSDIFSRLYQDENITRFLVLNHYLPEIIICAFLFFITHSQSNQAVMTTKTLNFLVCRFVPLVVSSALYYI